MEFVQGQQERSTAQIRRKYGDGPIRTIDNLEEVEKWRNGNYELQRIIESGNYALCIINRLVGALPQTLHTFLP
ncbi:MAG: hypothetical protein KBF95_06850 [Dysgonomonadaceae bacterium]|nr:hypothetical protein [Dysgonamonadaceae bacterium]